MCHTCFWFDYLQLSVEMLRNLSPPTFLCCFPLTPPTLPPPRRLLFSLHSSFILLLHLWIFSSSPPVYPIFLFFSLLLLLYPTLCFSSPFIFLSSPSLSSPPAWWCGGQVQGRSRESSQTQLWGNAAGPAAILQTSAAQETVLPAGRNDSSGTFVLPKDVLILHSFSWCLSLFSFTPFLSFPDNYSYVLLIYLGLANVLIVPGAEILKSAAWFDLSL